MNLREGNVFTDVCLATGEEEEDDFGDFGGFETAEPVEPKEAQPLPQGIQASPSPWALFPGSTSSVPEDTHVEQPQLLTTDHPRQTPQDSAFHANFDDKDTFQGFQAFDESTTKSSKDEGADAKIAPDTNQIGTSSTTNKLVGAFDDALCDTDEERDELQRCFSIVTDRKGREEKSSISNVSNNHADKPVNKELDSELQTNEISEERGTGEKDAASTEATKHLARLQEKLKLTEQDRTKLQKELEEVQGLQKQLQGELVQLQEQTARYEKLQAKHAAQLEEMRKAGHDALVLIVEEYKELCKTAVLQQQEASQQFLQSYLDERDTEDKREQKQREEELSKVMEDEKKKFEAQLQEKLEEVEEIHKSELKSSMATENEKAELLIKTAMETEAEKSSKAIEHALQEERSRSQKLLEEQRKDFLKLLSEEKETSKKEIEKSLVEERKRAKESIAAAVAEEREKSEEIKKQSKNQIKDELEKYIEMQKMEDLLARKRQLATMDLFLESARQQLKLLISDTETKDGS